MSYDKYVKEAAKRIDHNYSFKHLADYADQIAATYQEELIHLRDFRDNHICTDVNASLMKKQLRVRVQAENVHSIILAYRGDIPEELEDLYDTCSQMQAHEKQLVMNSREMGVITKRLLAMTVRNA